MSHLTMILSAYMLLFVAGLKVHQEPSPQSTHPVTQTHSAANQPPSGSNSPQGQAPGTDVKPGAASTGNTVAQPVSIEPDPAIPGQNVTIYLPSGAKKIVIEGGRFLAKTNITGKDYIIDTPKKTTTYIVDVWTSSNDQNGNASSSAENDRQQYKVTAEVYAGTFPKINTYHDPYGWRLDCPVGWKRQSMPQVDPANNALVFFQPQDDSPEKITVAILPMKTGSSDDLMSKAMDDAPTQYDVIENVKRKTTTQDGVPATWTTFKGIDRALDNIPTISMVIAFIHDGKGYVVSGRVRESRLEQDGKWMQSLVRSIGFEAKPTERPSSNKHVVTKTH